MNRKTKIWFPTLVVIVILTIAVLRGKRYYMYNMWPEEIDVTNWVVKHEYKPVYCNGVITKLINPSPHVLNKNEKKTIKHEVGLYASSRNPPLIKMDSIDYKYAYTYFVSRDPVDVYQLLLKCTEQTDTLYFRYVSGKVYGGLSADGWVITSCD